MRDMRPWNGNNNKIKQETKMKKNSRAAASITLALSLSLALPVWSQEIDLVEIVRNPAIGNYKGYAEFKMGHYANAATIWQALAERGNAEANFNLGILNEDGLGTPADMAAALAHYEKSAQAGSSKAQYRLALLYAAGVKVPKDAIKAEQWLTAAAANGDSEAQSMLSNQKASAPPTTARDQEFERAALLHASGKYKEAAAIWQPLAQQGDARSQRRLAWMMETGQGMARDLDGAGKLFRQSAEAGDADAQYALSVMLQTGKGQVQDPAQAEIWRERAAAQGHGPARDAAPR
jgi:TPR repeat protein